MITRANAAPALPLTCPRCGREFHSRKAWGKFCSSACRLRSWRRELQPMRFVVNVQEAMAHEAPDLSRVQVSELLGVAPIVVRRWEVDTASDFPRPVEVAPYVLRWRRGEVLAWAARSGRVAPGLQPYNTWPMSQIQTR